MLTCKIVSPGIVVNPNGTVLVSYVSGAPPLTGEEEVQTKSYPNLAAITQEVGELETSLFTPETFVNLPLASVLKDDPDLTNLSTAIGRYASLALTDPSAPITFG